jgi:hypothetical protein
MGSVIVYGLVFACVFGALWFWAWSVASIANGVSKEVQKRGAVHEDSEDERNRSAS